VAVVSQALAEALLAWNAIGKRFRLVFEAPAGPYGSSGCPHYPALGTCWQRYSVLA